MKKVLALLLAVLMVMALCACGAKEEAPAEVAPAAQGAAPEGAVAPPEGAELGEPTGEPVAELFDASGYSKDLEGYKQYAIDALKSDEHAPADVIDMTVTAIEAVTDGNSADFDMLISQGRILSYDDFIK